MSLEMRTYNGPSATFRFPAPLKKGMVISRPNRFIMLVRARKKVLKCHCPTMGRLGDLNLKGMQCLYSVAAGGRRKTAYIVEALSNAASKNSWIGINQTAANRYMEFFIRNGALARMAKGSPVREVRLGKSRIDFLVNGAYVEVKTPLITLPTSKGTSIAKHSKFDSFDRLIRHMGELRRAITRHNRAVIAVCYLYDAKPFRTPHRDRTNSRVISAARAAEKAGVERWQVNLRIDREGVSLIRYFKSTGL